MLTDKAKEKFGVFLKTKHKIGYWEYFESFPLVCQQALIVEWLDSEDLRVEVSYGRISESWICSINGIIEQTFLPSRQFALTKAIEKANTLINLK